MQSLRASVNGSIKEAFLGEGLSTGAHAHVVTAFRCCSRGVMFPANEEPLSTLAYGERGLSARPVALPGVPARGFFVVRA
jgi:hypothetical protein